MTTPTPNEIPTTVLKVSHHPAGHIATRYAYAAYGSNLGFNQMTSRCPRAEIVASGKLLGFRLAFAMVATIIPDDDSTTLVGIYQLTASDVETLDKREGLGRVYDRYLVTALTIDGRAIRCFTYIKKDDFPEAPSDLYYGRLAEGYRNWAFEDRRLRHARKRAVKEALARADERKARDEAEARAAARPNWYGWEPYNSHSGARKIKRMTYTSEQESLPFADVDRRGIAKVKSLVTGREIGVAKYATTAARNVEWGQRSGDFYWRVKGDRVWYRDISTHEDVTSGIARGELAQNLPGSQAYKIVDDNKGNSAT
jgi:hypothetical protein